MTARTAPAAPADAARGDAAARPTGTSRTAAALAPVRRPARLALAGLALAGTLAACGSDDDTVASADATPSALSCPITAQEVPAPEGATKDLTKKPVVAAAGKAAPPEELQYSDIVVGTGDEAKTGDAVQVKYVGAFYDTGKEFDSSWSRSPDETLPFGICRQGVVPGFAVGPTGMKEGGRRQIVLPPEYGYGAQGQPPTIPANSTLVFVVDLVQVGEDEDDASPEPTPTS
jgi:peptidylprolyl isomerase